MNAEDKKRLLRQMLFARRFEERCYEAYVERKIGGFLHLYPGQEACAHGVMAAARPGHDYVITGYRDHIHAILCGADPKEVMAELYGKETGSRCVCPAGYMDGFKQRTAMRTKIGTPVRKHPQNQFMGIG